MAIHIQLSHRILPKKQLWLIRRNLEATISNVMRSYCRYTTILYIYMFEGWREHFLRSDFMERIPRKCSSCLVAARTQCESHKKNTLGTHHAMFKCLSFVIVARLLALLISLCEMSRTVNSGQYSWTTLGVDVRALLRGEKQGKFEREWSISKDYCDSIVSVRVTYYEILSVVKSLKKCRTCDGKVSSVRFCLLRSEWVK